MHNVPKPEPVRVERNYPDGWDDAPLAGGLTGLVMVTIPDDGQLRRAEQAILDLIEDTFAPGCLLIVSAADLLDRVQNQGHRPHVTWDALDEILGLGIDCGAIDARWLRLPGQSNPPRQWDDIAIAVDTLRLRELRAVVNEWWGPGWDNAEDQPVATETPQRPEPALPNAMLSAPELARLYGVDPDRLRKRLERWRMDHDTGYIEVDFGSRAPREAKYLYQVSAVQPILERLRVDAASIKRPSKDSRND